MYHPKLTQFVYTRILFCKYRDANDGIIWFQVLSLDLDIFVFGQDSREALVWLHHQKPLTRY